MSALVDPETGEVVHLSTVLPSDGWVSGTGPLSEQDARTLTSKIQGFAARTYMLLREAHDRGAWKALGYTSWAEYVRAEFDISRSYAYRLICQAQVVAELEAAAEVSPIGDSRPLVTENQARAIAPIVEEVAAEVAEAVADLPADAVEERAEVARETVRKTVSKTTETASPAIAALRAKREAEAAPPEPVDLADAGDIEAARLGLTVAFRKLNPLLAIDPLEAADLTTLQTRDNNLRVAQHMREWATSFEAAMSPNLRSVK